VGVYKNKREKKRKKKSMWVCILMVGGETLAEDEPAARDRKLIFARKAVKKILTIKNGST
jgi:hypothetical protein